MDAFGTDSKSSELEKPESELSKRYGALEQIPSDGLDYDRDHATIVTGFTHDGDSEPADYLKQVIAASNTAEYLEGQGVQTEIKYILADKQSLEGKYSDVDHQDLDRRKEVLENFISLYEESRVEVVYQSGLSENESYFQILEEAKNEAVRNRRFAESVRDAIPPKIRDKCGLNGDITPEKVKEVGEYALEESTTVALSGADIKIGPPMEKLFDGLTRNEVFRDISGQQDELISLITSPTLPAAQDFSNGNGSSLGSETYQDLKQNEGVAPYKNSHIRVELRDDLENIERKLELAPLEQEIDMSLIAEELEKRNPTNEESLPEQLHKHFDRLCSKSSSNEGKKASLDNSTSDYEGNVQ